MIFYLFQFSYKILDEIFIEAMICVLVGLQFITELIEFFLFVFPQYLLFFERWNPNYTARRITNDPIDIFKLLKYLSFSKGLKKINIFIFTYKFLFKNYFIMPWSILGDVNINEVF